MISHRSLMIAIAGIGLLASLAYGSTQHYIGRVVSGEGADAKVVSTEISYISAKPPLGEEEMYAPDPEKNIIYTVDGWFCDRATFLEAVEPGQRLHLRNNRNQPVIYSLYSTDPFEAAGKIVNADPRARKITVRRMVDHTLEKTIKQQYTLPEDGVLRYEGEKATPEEALKEGRHVRAHGPRKQTILAITPEARLETVAERKKAYPAGSGDDTSFIWANEGCFAGFYHDKVFYTGEPFRPVTNRDASMINTLQPGPTGSEPKLDGTKYLINGHFIASRAAMRPGCRAVFLPDRIHSNKNASHVIVHPRDNGSIEGKVKDMKEDSLLLEVTHTPTGLVDDLVRRTVKVDLKDDAKYHLNGQPGASREKTLSKGNYVRVLPAWSGAALVREFNREKARISGYTVRNKLTGAVEQPVSADGPAKFHISFGHVLFSPLSPDRYVDATFTWKNGTVRNLELFNGHRTQDDGDSYTATNPGANLRFDGEKLAGTISGDFSGSTLDEYGKAGRYTFKITMSHDLHVLAGELKQMTVNGKDAGTITDIPGGGPDTVFGGVVKGRPARGQTGIYRLRLSEGSQVGWDLVLRVPRTGNGWQEGVAVFARNRYDDRMPVRPVDLELTDGGLTGSVAIQLDPTVVPDSDESRRSVIHLDADRSKENGPTYNGEYKTTFGRDPILSIRPDGGIEP